MRFFYAAATLAMMAGSAYGHARVFNVWIDGKEQPDGRETYIRAPPSNDPVKDITSKAIACNVNGAKAASGFVSAKAGQSIQFEWFHNTRQDDIIDGSHQGPVITYIAPLTDGSDGTGAIWSKIGEEGFSNGKWAVDNLRNGGKSAEVTIPSTLKAGKYLIRQEIIALHEADATFDTNPARGAQFYPACAQFDITGDGSDVPPQNFDFQKDYKFTDAGIHFNLYSDSASSYKIPGPAVWAGGSSAGGSGGSPPAPPSNTAAPVTTSRGAAVPTTLATQVSSAGPKASSAAAAPTAVPTGSPDTGCKSRRSLRARRAAN